jgi:hypothetical protein
MQIALIADRFFPLVLPAEAKVNPALRGLLDRCRLRSGIFFAVIPTK